MDSNQGSKPQAQRADSQLRTALQRSIELLSQAQAVLDDPKSSRAARQHQVLHTSAMLEVAENTLKQFTGSDTYLMICPVAVKSYAELLDKKLKKLEDREELVTKGEDTLAERVAGFDQRGLDLNERQSTMDALQSLLTEREQKLVEREKKFAEREVKLNALHARREEELSQRNAVLRARLEDVDRREKIFSASGKDELELARDLMNLDLEVATRNAEQQKDNALAEGEEEGEDESSSSAISHLVEEESENASDIPTRAQMLLSSMAPRVRVPKLRETPHSEQRRSTANPSHAAPDSRSPLMAGDLPDSSNGLDNDAEALLETSTGGDVVDEENVEEEEESEQVQGRRKKGRRGRTLAQRNAAGRGGVKTKEELRHAQGL